MLGSAFIRSVIGGNNSVGFVVRNARYFATSSKQTIGFVGLGNMGFHQAHNLAKSGYRVIAFDLNKDAVSKLQSLSSNVSTAATVSELTKNSDVVITMLPSSPHVKQVYTGKDGVFEGIKNNGSQLLIDTSTIDPTTTRDIASIAKKQYNTSYIDAPVSGGTGGAEAGTLTFMVGAPKESFDKAEPILKAMGKNIVHCGDVGAGQVVKICNNLILGISMIGVSEAMNVGVKLGVDPKVLASVINTSSGRCWSSDTYNPCPNVLPNSAATRGYTGGFMADLMKKDIGLALEAAKAAEARLPLGEVAKQVYDELTKNGLGTSDFSVVYKYLNEAKQK